MFCDLPQELHEEIFIRLDDLGKIMLKNVNKILYKNQLEEHNFPMEFLISKGYLNILCWYYDGEDKMNGKELLKLAVKYDQIPIFNFLKTRNVCIDYDIVINTAVKNCSLLILKKLMSESVLLDAMEIYTKAISQNRTDVLEWLVDLNTNPQKYLSTYTLLRFNNYKINFDTIAINACEKEKLDVVEWALNFGCELKLELILIAGHKRNMRLAQWLKDKCCTVTLPDDFVSKSEKVISTIAWLQEHKFLN